MCILFIAIEQHPKYPLIICANRDEFHQRPTQAMHVWREPNILAGKDLQAGGTWLGLSSTGKFAALTNFRKFPLSDAPKKSRGDLVLQALADTKVNMKTELAQQAEQYHGFNLIYGSLKQLFCYDSVNNENHQLSKGVHSICNGALDDIWPKMARGEKLLSEMIHSHENLSVNALFDLMTNDKQALPHLLPETGLDEEWEQLLSAIFIKSPTYGTRTTTIITQDVEGNVETYDRSYAPSGECVTKQQFNLTQTFNAY
ncbi:NRDE family protein [Colwellia psychrerythraea]|uniref:NRDE family protein n=1 Tax=Colwellia psychrerythraea TaxID=28229 RepID=A0A099KVG9_COLPS|nr:NRDE family protein [Colwellia psychrerythraea]KGJ94170.1 protein of unknown function DUF833 [Colwellia psychrerythraea]